MCKKIVVIGGDAAGMSAASKIRRTHKTGKLRFLKKAHIPPTLPVACPI